MIDLSVAQHNAAGQVALCYYQTTNPLIEVAGGTAYKFNTQHNICLAWVDESHAPEILRRTKRCCGNTHKTVFRIASETEVRRWTYGGR